VTFGASYSLTHLVMVRQGSGRVFLALRKQWSVVDRTYIIVITHKVAAECTENKRPCDRESPNRFPPDIHPRPTYLYVRDIGHRPYFRLFCVYLFDDARPETYRFHPYHMHPTLKPMTAHTRTCSDG